MPKQSSTPKVITKKQLARIERERRQINLIRSIAIVGIVVVVGLLIFVYLKINVLALREPVEVVNGVKITTGEWQERVKLQRIQMLNLYNQYSLYQQNFGIDYSRQLQQIQSMLQSPETVGQQVLDQMRDDILIQQEAQKRGITVSDAELEKFIQEKGFGFSPNGTPTPTTTPTEVSFPTLTSQQLTLYPSTSTPTESPTETVTPTTTPETSAPPASTSTPAPATPTLVPEPPTATATPYTLEGFQKQYKDALTNYKKYNISENTIRSAYRAELYRQKLTRSEEHTSELQSRGLISYAVF